MIPQTPNHHRLKISEHHHFDSKHFRLSGQIPKSHIWSESGHVWVKCYIPCVFVGFQSHVTLMSDLIRWDISVDATLKIQNKYIKRSMTDMLQMLQTYRYAGHGMICFPEPSNNHNKARCPISRDVLIIIAQSSIHGLYSQQKTPRFFRLFSERRPYLIVWGHSRPMRGKVKVMLWLPGERLTEADDIVRGGRIVEWGS